MKSQQQFHLIDESRLRNCIEYISNLPLKSGYIVTIKSEDETRSDAQHRLRWLWMEQLEKEMAGAGEGRDKERWNLFFKHKYMPHILIAQDQDYVEIFRTYKKTCDSLAKYEHGLRQYQEQFWGKVISTKDMNVKSMSKWLNCIEAEALHDYGIVLKTPEDLMWLKK